VAVPSPDAEIGAVTVELAAENRGSGQSVSITGGDGSGRSGGDILVGDAKRLQISARGSVVDLVLVGRAPVMDGRLGAGWPVSARRHAEKFRLATAVNVEGAPQNSQKAWRGGRPQAEHFRPLFWTVRARPKSQTLEAHGADLST
jgi:hypothetical protein